MKKLENFIFDFGGVLYEINHQRSTDKLKELIIRSKSSKILLIDEFLKSDLIIRYEKGMLSTLDFVEHIKNDLSIVADNDEIIEAVNMTLVGIYPDSVEIISDFSKLGNIVLLSNTCQIHYDYFYPQCKELFSLFHRCFFSHQTGLRKPEHTAYQYVLDTMQYKPHCTLFVDDLKTNIIAAKELGMKTFNISNHSKLSSLLHTVKSHTHIF